MSTSEFKRKPNSEQDNLSSLSNQGGVLPTDFDEEELAFVQELQALFVPENEELPPYFAQTLLQPEDPRFQPVEPGFELKTSARVFRRLKLRRRLFYSHRSLLGSVIHGLSTLPAKRSLFACVAALILIMVFTVAFTSPSFALGMEILLQGARSGIYQVHSYPKGVLSPARQENAIAQSKEINLLAAQQLLHFRMYWPEQIPDGYALHSTYLYQHTRDWADGPVIDLEYDYSSYGKAPHGSGRIMISEFKPVRDVFQVVEAGAGHALEIDQNGQARAIYVDGQWVASRGSFPHWAYGIRSELIYQQNGVVFWIVGDQRDGINENVLLNIASSLQPMDLSRAAHKGINLNYTTQIVDDLPGPFISDIIAVADDSGMDFSMSPVNPSPLPPAKAQQGVTHSS